jgi:hypothetical protein
MEKEERKRNPMRTESVPNKEWGKKFRVTSSSRKTSIDVDALTP